MARTQMSLQENKPCLSHSRVPGEIWKVPMAARWRKREEDRGRGSGKGEAVPSSQDRWEDLVAVERAVGRTW